MERGPAKPPPRKFREIKDEVVYAGRKETFAYLHAMGIISYSSWDGVYFIYKDDRLIIFDYE
jgi:hypothetical protein